MKKTILTIALLACSSWAAALDIQRWQTANGAQIILVSRHDLPMVDLAVLFKDAGSTADPVGKSDTSSAAAALALRGTQTLDEEQFMQKINGLGSSLSSGSRLEYSIFGFRSLSDPNTLHTTADLFAQALSAPRYDARVLRRIQDQAVQSLKQSESYPDFLTSRARADLNYPDHPYGKGARRTEASLRAVSVSDLRRFQRGFYAQNKAVVAIVGDINRQQADSLVNQILHRLPIRAQSSAQVPPVHVRGGQTRHVAFSGSQSSISLSLPVFKRDNPDYFALMVGNYILGGGGFDSRLMKVLRDEKGYTYGAGSSITPYAEKGPLTIAFTTERSNSKAALAAAKQVLADFVANGPSETELKQAQDHITGSFPLRFDSNDKLLGQILDIALHQRPNDWLDTYNDKIRALTTNDIRAAWQRHIQPDQMNVVITGGE